MTREEKGQVIAELTEKLSGTNYFYVADAGGMSVAQTNAFRRKCAEFGVEYKVYKNTFIKKALETLEADTTALEDTLKGFSGIIFAAEDAGNAPAKAIKGFRKDSGSEKPVLKGAYIDTDLFIGDENVDVLSKLKSKNELIGEVVGLLQSPAKNVISALSSGGQTLAGLIKTLQERGE